MREAWGSKASALFYLSPATLSGVARDEWKKEELQIL